MRSAYRCRLYPTPEQASALNRTFGCCRLVWNHTLAERQRLYATEKKSTNAGEASANLTKMKRQPEFAFLNEVSSVALQQTLRHQQAAFSAFFAKRARYPRFKSRLAKQSATFARNGFSWRAGELCIARVNRPLPFIWSWPALAIHTLDPSTVTVTRDKADRWFVTLHVEVEQPAPLPATLEAIGVDLGLKDFAVLSNGDRIGHPKCMEERQRRLARYQRQMARKKFGSANRRKARLKVARQHAKITDARRDFLHKESAKLVRRFDVVCIEDLAVKNMVRNHKLARSIADSGWGEFRRMLEYKAERYGRRIAVVDRFYPSSKTCSDCGHLLAALSLGTRHWVCPSCGSLHDRDINAAKNLVAAGLAVDACGGTVRPSGATQRQAPLKQEPKPREGVSI